MICQLHLKNFEIYGNTYAYRQLFKDCRLQWNPTKKCWYGEDFAKIATVQRWLKNCGAESLRVVSPTVFKPKKKIEKPVVKEISVKPTYEKRKIAAIQGMSDMCIPIDVQKSIVGKMYTNWEQCRCRGNSQCLLCKYACCELAIGRFCVCTQATSCVKHGYKCNGTHD